MLISHSPLGGGAPERARGAVATDVGILAVVRCGSWDGKAEGGRENPEG